MKDIFNIETRYLKFESAQFKGPGEVHVATQDIMRTVRRNVIEIEIELQRVF
jgi:hypothetical protein